MRLSLHRQSFSLFFFWQLSYVHTEAHCCEAFHFIILILLLAPAFLSSLSSSSLSLSLSLLIFALRLPTFSVAQHINFKSPRNCGSPNASHIKVSQPHFPHFRFRVVRVFAPWNLLGPFFFGVRGASAFSAFWEKSKWGLSKWGLKVLVHNCHESSP